MEEAVLDYPLVEELDKIAVNLPAKIKARSQQ